MNDVQTALNMEFAFSDEKLWDRFRMGDDGAFRQIFERYDRLLFLYAFKKLNNKEDAKDVVQDVFVWLLKNRENLILKTSLAAYLYKSTLNKILDIFRHNQIIKKHLEAQDHYIEVESSNTDYLIREKDIRAMIELEISQMPPRMREIYDLKRKSFLSNKEIAQRLGISELTVKTQFKRALRILRTRFGLLIYILYIFRP